MANWRSHWIRMIDVFLPRAGTVRSSVENFRARTLIQLNLMGVSVFPALFLVTDSSRASHSGWIVLLLGLASILNTAFYRWTGALRASCSACLSFSYVALAWAQWNASTIYAPFWIWSTFLIIAAVLLLGVKQGGLYSFFVAAGFLVIQIQNARQGHSIGRFTSLDSLVWSCSLHLSALMFCLLVLLLSYDTIRNKDEQTAVMMQTSSTESRRLAQVGQRMGTMASSIKENYEKLQQLMSQLEALAKRTDTRIEDIQNLARELQVEISSLRDRARRVAQLDAEDFLKEERKPDQIRSA